MATPESRFYIKAIKVVVNDFRKSAQITSRYLEHSPLGHWRWSIFLLLLLFIIIML